MEEGKESKGTINETKDTNEIKDPNSVYPDPDDPIQTPQPEKDEKQNSNSPPNLVSEEENLVRSVLYFKNPFDAMGLPATATVDDINKKYKKLSLMLHPDKCKHPRAQEAFQSLTKAHKILQEEPVRRRFAEYMEEARKRVTDEVKKSKKYMTPSMFEYEVKMKTHRLLADMDHYNKRAESMKKANENREKDEIKKKKEEDAKQVEVEKKWEEGRTERVDAWRQFKKPMTGVKRKGVELKPPKPKLVQK